MIAIAGAGYGLIGLLVIILLVVLIIYFVRVNRRVKLGPVERRGTR